MPVRPKPASRVLIESLESRQLLATINITDFGARPNDGADDGPAIDRAIRSAARGDTVSFPAGTFDVFAPLTFKGDVSYKGVPGSVLKSNIPRGKWAVHLAANASNVNIESITFDGAGQGGGLAMFDGQRYSNIRIHGNTFQNIGNNGIKATIRTESMSIECNVFQNITGYGAILVYNPNKMNYSYNRILDSTHGGHILGPRDDVQIRFNHLTGIRVIGIEIQRLGQSQSQNLLIEGNLIYDWKSPSSGAIPLSLVAEGGLNTRIINNFIRTNLAPGASWGNQNWMGQIFGVGIEAGFETGVVEGNIVGGPYKVTNHVGAGGRNMLVRNNQFYGTPAWGAWIASWPSQYGPGTFIDDNNLKDRNIGNQPANPTLPACNALPQPQPQPDPNPNPNPTPNPNPRIAAPSDLKATAIGSNRVDLTWTDNSTNELGFKIERSFTSATGPFTQVGLVSANITRWTNTGLPAGKTMWYRVRAYGTVGNSDYSNVKEVKTGSLGGGTTNSSGGGTSLFAGPTQDNESPFSDLLI